MTFYTEQKSKSRVEVFFFFFFRAITPPDESSSGAGRAFLLESQRGEWVTVAEKKKRSGKMENKVKMI